MEKTIKVIAVIFALIILTLFGYNVIMFGNTGDLSYGIWALLLSVTTRVKIEVKPSVGERK